MKKNPVTRVLCLLLALLFATGVMVVPTSAASTGTGTGGNKSAAEEQIESMQKYLESEAYEMYYYKYVTQSSMGPGNREYAWGTDIVFDPTNSSEQAKQLLTLDQWVNAANGATKAEILLNPADFKEGAIYSPANGTTSFTVNIDAETEGMYYLVLDYYGTGETVNSIERKLYIDNKMPFSEASAFSMTKTWEYEYLTGDAVANLRPDATKEEIAAAKKNDSDYKWDVQNNNKYYGRPQAGFRHDIINNDLTPPISQVSTWKTYICSDAEGYELKYFQFYLDEGKHTITFDAIREGAIFHNIRLVPAGSSADEFSIYEIPSFVEYLAKTEAAAKAAGLEYSDVDLNTKKYFIPAELPDYVSDSSVAMTNNKNSCITYPSNPSFDKYNVIGANSYNSVGQWAAYNFTPSRSGYYAINMRYLQNVLDGMFVSRSVKITSHGQGEYVYGIGDTPTAPFSEANNLRYNFSNKWQVDPLKDGKTYEYNDEKYKSFKFYFEEDVTYTIYFEVSLGALSNQLNRVEKVLEKLNECYLQILRITGPDPDENTDYEFERIIPETLIDLCEAAEELYNVRNEFARICGVKQASHLSTLDNIIRQVATMGSDEEEVAGGLSDLKSNLGTLGTWITNSKTSTLIIDFISIGSPKAVNGKANANFFQTLWYEICAFFASFRANYDLMGVTDPNLKNKDPLEVWLANGRDQSKIVRNMIDADFADFCSDDVAYTKNKEIPVSLKLVVGGTLLPSILAGRGPDVYMGLDAGSVMNYSIRNAIVPVSGMSDFTNVKSQFVEAAMDAIKLPDLKTLYDDTKEPEEKWKYYGLPMTMSFAMMFYRTDFLVRQGIAVPETWNELLSLLPVLTDNNMEIGLNYTLALDFFLYQAGGSMWKFEDDPAFAGAEVGLDTDEGIRAFNFCVSLYTEHSFPIYFDAANRFRTGEMPIVIQDYVSTYNQLIVFATEIEGLWSFSHIPGFAEEDEFGNEVVDENGNRNINYTSMASISAAVITSDGKDRIDEAWQYMKWCTSDRYVSDYSNRIVSLLGPSAKYASASKDALADMSWTSAEREAIIEQMEHLDTIVNYPGSYYIGRNTNFAFLDAVNNGTEPKVAIEKYLDAINAEITRKREEFDLPTIKDMKDSAGK